VTALLWVCVALLCGAGAVLRVVLDGAVQGRLAGRFPSGTLAVNTLGSFLLGLLHGAGVTGDALLLSGTALLGSFTTFSTWMVQTERLASDGEGRLAVANILGSLAVGVAACALGWAIAAVL
jgi:CrcB protein